MWYARQDSNLRSSAPEADALSPGLRARGEGTSKMSFGSIAALGDRIESSKYRCIPPVQFSRPPCAETKILFLRYLHRSLLLWQFPVSVKDGLIKGPGLPPCMAKTNTHKWVRGRGSSPVILRLDRRIQMPITNITTQLPGLPPSRE